jgi:hypothetical protein
MPQTRRHLIVRLLTALGLVAAFSPAVHAQEVRVRLGAWIEPVVMDTLRQDFELQAPPAKVYEAALKAFASLGIPMGKTDGKTGIIGSDRFEVIHTLAGSQLSHWFSCGEGAMGNYANTFRVDLVAVIWIKPSASGGGTTLGVAAAASARDPSGDGHGSRRCGSEGTLELKIVDKITELSAS